MLRNKREDSEVTMSKKEFRKLCKKQKTKSYQYSVVSVVTVLIALVIVGGTLVLDQVMGIVPYPTQVVGYLFGGAVAVVAIVFDIVKEVAFSREYKEYIKSVQ